MWRMIAVKISIWAIAMAMISPGPLLSAEPTALDEVKIGYTCPSISAFPIEFARRKGFFREEG